jgi:hypothetical protein
MANDPSTPNSPTSPKEDSIENLEPSEVTEQELKKVTGGLRSGVIESQHPCCDQTNSAK